jgi:TPR repeat protein
MTNSAFYTILGIPCLLMARVYRGCSFTHKLFNNKSIGGKNLKVGEFEFNSYRKPEDNPQFPFAEFEMGQHYYYGSVQLGISQDYIKAFNYFYVAAAQGHAEALYFQGLMYLKGIGVTLDMNQALLSLNIAANQNENKALDILGKIYHFGYCDISPDHKKAESYYRIAVNQGYPPSMFHLALLFENQHRFEEAYELIIQSANKGYMEAINYNMSTYK